MSLEALAWHEPFLPLFHLEASMLPAIVSNAEVYGHVAAGPMQGVPIAGASPVEVFLGGKGVGKVGAAGMLPAVVHNAGVHCHMAAAPM